MTKDEFLAQFNLLNTYIESASPRRISTVRCGSTPRGARCFTTSLRRLFPMATRCFSKPSRKCAADNARDHADDKRDGRAPKAGRA